MVRTQVQLTEEQLAALRRVAARESASIADLVRRAVDAMLEREPATSQRARRKRAASVAGRFASGHSDVSRAHDRHVAEAFGS